MCSDLPNMLSALCKSGMVGREVSPLQLRFGVTVGLPSKSGSRTSFALDFRNPGSC